MAKRNSIYLSAYGHVNPIPVACRVGNLLMSGIVYGRDPKTGKPADTLEQQCALMFKYVKDIVEESGGKIDDIVKISILMKDRNQREAVNKEWLRLFPDPENRPARQTMSALLDGGKLVQCDFVASFDEI